MDNPTPAEINRSFGISISERDQNLLLTILLFNAGLLCYPLIYIFFFHFPPQILLKAQNLIEDSLESGQESFSTIILVVFLCAEVNYMVSESPNKQYMTSNRP